MRAQLDEQDEFYLKTTARIRQEKKSFQLQTKMVKESNKSADNLVVDDEMNDYFDSEKNYLPKMNQSKNNKIITQSLKNWGWNNQVNPS